MADVYVFWHSMRKTFVTRKRAEAEVLCNQVDGPFKDTKDGRSAAYERALLLATGLDNGTVLFWSKLRELSWTSSKDCPSCIKFLDPKTRRYIYRLNTGVGWIEDRPVDGAVEVIDLGYQGKVRCK